MAQWILRDDQCERIYSVNWAVEDGENNRLFVDDVLWIAESVNPTI